VKITIWTVGLASREKATKSIVAVACLMDHFRDEMHFKIFKHSLLALLKFTCKKERNLFLYTTQMIAHG